MAEYIERETLLQTLEEVGGCDAPPDSWADGWDKGISEAIKFVKELPAADVVKVVRCKDCENYELMKSNNTHFCNKFGGHVTEKDFCSRCTPKEQGRDGDMK